MTKQIYSKGQQVKRGEAIGTIVDRLGHVLQVLVERDKLVMAGTFPDRPIGSHKVKVKEFWHDSKVVSIEGGAR